MKTTRPSLSRYLVGMVASLIIALAGGWLILASFALGYQPYGADWVSQTTHDFVMGISVAVVALLAFTLFFISLLAALLAAGVLAARTRPEPVVVSQPQATVPLSSASNQSDLDKTLATLAAALAVDLNARRQGESNQANDQTIDQSMNRRDV